LTSPDQGLFEFRGWPLTDRASYNFTPPAVLWLLNRRH
jgi:hypothetical protein